MTKSNLSTALVYSTESGRMCPACRQPIALCKCPSAKQAKAAAAMNAPADGVVRVQRETKGRGGKSVTVVKGLALEAAALAQLAKQLKAACGSGGTVKEGVIEVQGDHVEAVMAALQKQGHRVKRVGG
jgi:translation initiation factor 1